MEWYTGPTWTVGEPGTDGFYVFGDEKTARWYQQCMTTHEMTLGSTPRDDGNFFLTPQERDDVLKKEPGLAKFIRRVFGSKEFIQNIERYCFWLVDASPSDIKHSRILYERVSRVREFRLASTRAATQKLSDSPHLFTEIRQPTTHYLLIPRHSSSKRQYVPMGYVSPDVIATDAVFILPYATPYHFGILTSRVHMGWMRRVCGRLKSDCRYSNTIVYNNFVWPMSSPKQVRDIESTAQKILDVRAKHKGCSLADLYDEVSMPKDLRDAHAQNDAAVLKAYGLAEDTGEEDVVMHMFGLYYAALGQEMPE